MPLTRRGSILPGTWSGSWSGWVVPAGADLKDAMERGHPVDEWKKNPRGYGRMASSGENTSERHHGVSSYAIAKNPRATGR